MIAQQPAKEKQSYKYFAFISYSSKDLRWGRRLQRSLERYRLPSHLAKKYKDKPARAYPICRDETAFAGFKVRSEIQEKLDESRFLIVLCSPRSAKSDWVNDEIQYFIDQGGENRILPFIIDGIPHSGNPDTECYPPALLAMAEDPLGVNVQALGKHQSYLQMVSALLDVDFEELTRRDTKRRIRNGCILGFAGLLAAAAITGGIVYNLPHSSYYNAVAFRNEIPEGLYPLTEDQVRAASDSYRITTQRGKVIRLETVNSLGVAIEPLSTSTTTDYPILEYEYNDSGDLITILQKDATGKEVSRKDLTANPATREIAIDFHSPGNSLDALALSADMSAQVIGDRQEAAKSEITRQRNTYDENGRLIRTLYQRDNLGTPACDSNGVYGKLYEYNEQGLPIRISNLDENGQVYNCKYGWAYEITVFDENGNGIFSQYYDAQGNKARGKEGYSAAAAEYDENGNPVMWKCMDETGALCHNSDGYAFQTAQYDENGFLCSVKLFDIQSMPTYNTAGIHEGRYEHDAQGRHCGTSYFDIDGQPIYSSINSCASFQSLLDEDGRILEHWQYDAQGELTCYRDIGVYGYRNTYDDAGNLCKQEFLDENGELTISRYGYAVWIAEYDSAGHLLREEFRDENGNLTRNTYNNAIAEYAYDTFGNCIEARNYDENGDPCYHTQGYSSIRWVYENGNLVSENYYDTHGEPMLGGEYFHEVRYDFDEKGNCIRWSYYDTQGNLTLLTAGYAVTEQDYDTYGNITAKRYYDTEGLPVMVDLCYEFRWEYDDRGNCIREEQLSYMPDQLTYSIFEMEYDLQGNRITELYYDENGDPIDLETYGARVELSYDARGNCLETKCFGPDGLPLNPGSDVDQNIRRNTFDVFGNLIRIEYLNQDASGNIRLLWQEVYTYDPFGNCIQKEFLDAEGKLLPNALGYSTLVKAYSPTGFVILEEYYDENGDPCIYDGEAFRYEYTRDTVGNMIEKRRYGADGKLLPESGGIPAIVRYEYDSRGKVLSYRLYNENDAPFNYPDISYFYVEHFVDVMGYAYADKAYDESGNLIWHDTAYVYINEVNPGSSAEEAGILAGDFLIRLNDWELYNEDVDSVLHAFHQALVSCRSAEKELILCRWEEDGSFTFRRVHLPEGVMGCGLTSDVGNGEILGNMKQAYFQWLEENPA